MVLLVLYYQYGMFNRVLRKFLVFKISQYCLVKICKMTVQVHTKNSERIGSDMKCSGPKKFYNSEGDFF